MRYFSHFVLSFACLMSSATAATLFSDDFNSEAVGLNESLENWTITRGTVDVVGPTSFPFLCPANNCVDLDGSTNMAARIESNIAFNLMTGNVYTLYFDLAGSQRGDDNTLTAFLGAMSLPITLPSDAAFSTFSLSVTPLVNTSALIVFDHQGGDLSGLLLDNVRLESESLSQIPEPSTYALLLSGVAVFAFRARKQRA